MNNTSYPLSTADPNWLQRVYRGQLCLAITLLVFLAAVLVLFILDVVFDISGESLRDFFIYEVLIVLLSLAVLLFGAVSVTAPDPRQTGAGQPLSLRRLARGAAVVSMVIVPLHYFMRAGIFADTTVVSFIQGALGWTFGTALVLTVVAVTLYLSQLAERVPDARVAQNARYRAKGFVLCVVVAVVAQQALRIAGFSGDMLPSAFTPWGFVHLIGSLFMVAAFVYGVGIASTWSQLRDVFKQSLLKARETEKQEALKRSINDYLTAGDR